MEKWIDKNYVLKIEIMLSISDYYVKLEENLNTIQIEIVVLKKNQSRK